MPSQQPPLCLANAIPVAPKFWQFRDGQLKLAGICPFKLVKQSKGAMMMARKFFSIGAIMMMSLLGAQAFAAGSDDYAPTSAKPAAYNKALALIKDKNYDQAIVKLKEAEAAAKKDADIQNLLGFAHRKSGKLGAAANIINLPWHSIQSIRAPWNIKANCF
jgi:hypothetical protein